MKVSGETTSNEKKPISETADKVIVASNKLASIMRIVDSFSAYEIHLMRKGIEELGNNIAFNQAVSIVAAASGGKMYNPTEDRLKVEELEYILAIVEARNRLRDCELEKLTAIDGNSLYR